jgi:spore germination protein KB
LKEENKITASQFMFSVACFLQASSLLTGFFGPITMQDSWLTVCFALLLVTPVCLIYLKLMQTFPELNLLEIYDRVYGPVLGKMLAWFYIWFFYTLTAINLRDVQDFLNLTIMVETPRVVLLVVFIFLCAYAVYNGVKVVTQYSSLFVFIFMIVLVIGTIFTINHMNMENFLPVLTLPARNYLHATNIVLTIPFGELVVFLMIAPSVQKVNGGLGKYLFSGLAMGGFAYLVAVFRDTSVLGNTIALFAFPSFETLRMVNLFQALSRLEILFALVFIILLFFKVSFLFYVSVKALAYVFAFKSYRSLVMLSGALLFTYALFVYISTVDHAIYATETTPQLWLLLEAIIPFLTLMLAKLRKLPQREER